MTEISEFAIFLGHKTVNLELINLGEFCYEGKFIFLKSMQKD
jgi:hypothetical protein